MAPPYTLADLHQDIRDDPLRPARGIAVGVLLGVPAWVGLVGLVRALFA